VCWLSERRAGPVRLRHNGIVNESDAQLVKTVALGPIEFDRNFLHWRVGIFGSAVAALTILLGEYGGWSTKIMPLAVGLIFVPLAGMTEPVSRRMLSQL